MATANVVSVRDDFVDDGFSLALRLQVAIVIGKALNGIGVSDVNPLRIGARRIKCDAKRLAQPGSECGCLLGLAVFSDAAENLNLSALALRDKNIPIGSGSHFA